MKLSLVAVIVCLAIVPVKTEDFSTCNVLKCYAVINTAMTWDDAQNYCENYGGFLAEILNTIDDNVIKLLFYQSIRHFQSEFLNNNNMYYDPVKEDHSLWLGGSDREDEKEWKWVYSNSKILTYDPYEITDLNKWRVGRPNSTDLDHIQNCLRYNGEAWFDHNCSTEFPFVCQRNELPVKPLLQIMEANLVEFSSQLIFSALAFDLSDKGITYRFYKDGVFKDDSFESLYVILYPTSTDSGNWTCTILVDGVESEHSDPQTVKVYTESEWKELYEEKEVEEKVDPVLSVLQNILSYQEGNQSTDFWQEKLKEYMTERKSALNNSRVFINIYLKVTPPFVLMFLFTIKRKNLYPDTLGGRPGVIYPLEQMTRSYPLIIACAFGSCAYRIMGLYLLKKMYPLEVSEELRALDKILMMIISSIVFFLLFLSVTLETALSYTVGTLYVWGQLGLRAYAYHTYRGNKVYLLIQLIPEFLFTIFLSIAFPFQAYSLAREGIYVTNKVDKTMNDLTISKVQDSYEGKYVRELLRRKLNISLCETKKKGMKNKIIRILTRIYTHDKGFRYPASLLSTILIGSTVVYAFTVEIVYFYLFNIDYSLRKAFKMAFEAANVTTLGDTFDSEYFPDIIRACVIITVVLTTLLQFVTLLNLLGSYRANLQAVYRGHYKFIPSPYESNGVKLTLGSCKFSAYQIASVTCGYIISAIVIFALTCTVAVLYSIIKYGYYDWIENLGRKWPGILVYLCIYFLQKYLTKHAFLKDKGKYIRLDNRRCFFLFAYFMFFFNIFIGLFSCLKRVVIATILGIFYVGRLDNPVLPRKWEKYDTGFKCYKGYVLFDAAQTHPVVVLFINLLAAMRNERKQAKPDGSVCFEKDDDAREGRRTQSEDQSYFAGKANSRQSKNPSVYFVPDYDEWKSGKKYSKFAMENGRVSNRAARFRWFVVYSLLTNPEIRALRKAYVQTLKKARKEGLRLPMSDRLMAEGDLVKLKVKRDSVRYSKKSINKEDNLTVETEIQRMESAKSNDEKEDNSRSVLAIASSFKQSQKSFIENKIDPKKSAY